LPDRPDTAPGLADIFAAVAGADNVNQPQFPVSHPIAIWSDASGAGRNRFALFRFGFFLDQQPATGSLHLFADTRYRLAVNGTTLGHGPARFKLVAPEFDTHDILPYLRKGRNVIAVTVNSYGTSSFHSDKSTGALVAWGEATDRSGQTVRFDSGPNWKALASPAHDPATPSLSFALNPGELLDARNLPANWMEADFDDSHWPAAIAVQRPAAEKLRPRSIPLLDESLVHPPTLAGAWDAGYDPNDEIHSLIAISTRGEGISSSGRQAVFCYIHSPQEQTVEIGAWWGKYWINGQPLAKTSGDSANLRQNFSAPLRTGWNTFLMYESLHGDWWDFYLAVPKSAGLTVAAEPRLDCPDVFLLGGLWEGELAAVADAMQLPLNSPADLPAKLGPWKKWPRGKSANTPVRERAWKRFRRIAGAGPIPVDVSPLCEKATAGTLSLLFDFCTEVLGRPVLEFSAAAGTIIDVTYSEQLRADGTADVPPRFFVDVADRYISREGRQTWQGFHPRGCRYFEVLITGDLDSFALHSVAISRNNYPVQYIGDFACSDEKLNRIWKLGRVTQHQCMEDAYTDCPWRERGLYGGDYLVQFFTNLATFGDVKLFRRCTELFLLGLGDNGLPAACAHGLPPGRHPDYAALIVHCLWTYWSRTGDVVFLRESLLRLRALLAGLAELGVPVGGGELLDGSEYEPYIDLGRTDHAGILCTLNCFYYKAFSDGAKILRLAGESAEAEQWSSKADRLAAAIRDAFWDEKAGVFLDRPNPSHPSHSSHSSHPFPSVQGNTLPLLFDIATPAQAERALPWILAAMADNRQIDAQGLGERGDMNVQAYFSFYALAVLYKYGKVIEAEQFMRTNWSYMLDGGAWTCWEFFNSGSAASVCHAWSSSPTHYLSTMVLGITFPEPGNINRVTIAPHPGTLTWAKGIYPHPAGPIEVKWQITSTGLKIDWKGPSNVTVNIAGRAIPL
jgi:alpha-L-rhamnosidase